MHGDSADADDEFASRTLCDADAFGDTAAASDLCSARGGLGMCGDLVAWRVSAGCKRNLWGWSRGFVCTACDDGGES